MNRRQKLVLVLCLGLLAFLLLACVDDDGRVTNPVTQMKEGAELTIRQVGDSLNVQDPTPRFGDGLGIGKVLEEVQSR